MLRMMRNFECRPIIHANANANADAAVIVHNFLNTHACTHADIAIEETKDIGEKYT